jgi:PEP-CTERM motif
VEINTKQTFLGSRRTSNLAIISAAVLVSASAWAGPSGCSTANPFTAVSTLTANGCFQADQTFYNFTQGAGAGDVIGGTPNVALAGNFIDGSGTFTKTAAFTVGETFLGTAAGGGWTETGTGGATKSGDFIQTVNSNDILGGDTQSGYITSVSLGAVGSTGADATDELIVSEKFCLGAGTTPCTTNFVTIKATYLGSTETAPTTTSCVVTGTIAGVTCNGPTSLTATILASDHVTSLIVENGYQLEAHGNTTVTLTSFEDSFGGTAPEPSTFLLFGSALAGIAALRRRKSKKA